MSEIVHEVQRMAQTLVSSEIRSGESAEGAMRRVARTCGVSYFTLWQLRYRAPKRVFADVYLAILKAHEAMREQQNRKFQHEALVAEARGNPSALVRAASALAGRGDGGSE